VSHSATAGIKMSGLTTKQAAFVEEYFIDFNATQAAKRAGYGGSNPTLAAIGSENLTKPKIIQRVSARLAESAMLADEVLARLAEIARGEHGKYVTVDGSVDFAQLVADDKAYLVKSIRDTAQGKSIEFCDMQKALVDIGRHHQLFTDSVDVTSGGDKLLAADDIVTALRVIQKTAIEPATDEPNAAA